MQLGLGEWWQLFIGVGDIDVEKMVMYSMPSTGT